MHCNSRGSKFFISETLLKGNNNNNNNKNINNNRKDVSFKPIENFNILKKDCNDKNKFKYNSKNNFNINLNKKLKSNISFKEITKNDNTTEIPSLFLIPDINTFEENLLKKNNPNLDNKNYNLLKTKFKRKLFLNKNSTKQINKLELKSSTVDNINNNIEYKNNASYLKSKNFTKLNISKLKLRSKFDKMCSNSYLDNINTLFEEIETNSNDIRNNIEHNKLNYREAFVNNNLIKTINNLGLDKKYLSKGVYNIDDNYFKSKKNEINSFLNYTNLLENNAININPNIEKQNNKKNTIINKMHKHATRNNQIDKNELFKLNEIDNYIKYSILDNKINQIKNRISSANITKRINSIKKLSPDIAYRNYNMYNKDLFNSVDSIDMIVDSKNHNNKSLICNKQNIDLISYYIFNNNTNTKNEYNNLINSNINTRKCKSILSYSNKNILNNCFDLIKINNNKTKLACLNRTIVVNKVK